MGRNRMRRNAAVLLLLILLVGCGPAAEHTVEEESSALMEETSLPPQEDLPEESAPEEIFPPRPRMSMQAQLYYEKYLYPFELSRLWRNDFGEDSFPTEKGLMNCLYCKIRNPSTDPLEPYTEDKVVYWIDGQLMEETLQAVFPVATQEIRESFGPDYLEEEGIYLVRYGFGGMAPVGVVESWEDDGETLTLHTTWYGWIDEVNDYVRPLWKSVTVLRPGEMGQQWYLSNQVEILHESLW